MSLLEQTSVNITSRKNLLYLNVGLDSKIWVNTSWISGLTIKNKLKLHTTQKNKYKTKDHIIKWKDNQSRKPRLVTGSNEGEGNIHNHSLNRLNKWYKKS